MPAAHAERKRQAKWRTDLAIHEALAVARQRNLSSPFKRLLTAVVSRSSLLRPGPVGGRTPWARAQLLLPALLTLCEHHRAWLHEPEAWDAPDVDPWSEFGALARHLLADYWVPDFMTRVWFEERSPVALQHQKLFKHLGRGGNVRGADVPLRLTKPMARFFNQAPAHFTVEQALRWGQIRGLGGTPQMAAAVASTHLGSSFHADRLWLPILKFLIASPRLDANQVTPLIRFLQQRRQVRELELLSKIINERRLQTLLDEADTWPHNEVAAEKRPALRWPNSSIKGLYHVEPHQHPWSIKYWTIRELTSSGQLEAEGLAQQHCVASYDYFCMRRVSSIWSLRRHGSLSNQRMVTILVLQRIRCIITALGKCNTRPTPEAMHVIKLWAEQEDLEVHPRVLA